MSSFHRYKVKFQKCQYAKVVVVLVIVISEYIFKSDFIQVIPQKRILMQQQRASLQAQRGSSVARDPSLHCQRAQRVPGPRINTTCTHYHYSFYIIGNQPTFQHCGHSSVLLNWPYKLSTRTLLSLLLNMSQHSAAITASDLPHSPSFSSKFKVSRTPKSKHTHTHTKKDIQEGKRRINYE